jgi:hypothetical protein
LSWTIEVCIEAWQCLLCGMSVLFTAFSSSVSFATLFVNTKENNVTLVGSTFDRYHKHWHLVLFSMPLVSFLIWIALVCSLNLCLLKVGASATA